MKPIFIAFFLLSSVAFSPKPAPAPAPPEHIEIDKVGIYELKYNAARTAFSKATVKLFESEELKFKQYDQ